MPKTLCRIKHKNRIEAEKNNSKNGKAVYGKTMENLRKRNDVRQVSNKKDYLK